MLKKIQAETIRYQKLEELGKKIFHESSDLQEGKVTEYEVGLARKFVREAAHLLNPAVWSSYWEHVLMAPELGRHLSQGAALASLSVNRHEIEFLLWLHEIGRLIAPGAYLHNDFLAERLFAVWKIPQRLTQELLSVGTILAQAQTMELTREQEQWQQPLTADQKVQIKIFFDTLSPAARVINFSDNLGKSGKQGLLTMDEFYNYLVSQETRYHSLDDSNTTAWIATRRPGGAILQYHLILLTLHWLKEHGIDYEKIRDDMKDYGVKFILLVRHGEIGNPKNIAYNRDIYMKPEDVIHISSRGKEQMKTLAATIQTLKFSAMSMKSSPEIRTVESAEILSHILKLSCSTDPDLDEADASGPYSEGMSLDELLKSHRFIYSDRWQKYHHESPKAIVDRMEKAFWQMASELGSGQTGILISYGDPLFWLHHKLYYQKLAKPTQLFDPEYPAKGQAIVVVVEPDNLIFTTYFLNRLS